MDLLSDDEKKEIEEINNDNKEMLEFMKKSLDDAVINVKFTNKLKDHPVCLTSEGDISVEMEKV